MCQIVTFSGICLEYPMQGCVEIDVKSCYKDSIGDRKQLPNLPKCVSGTTDFLISIKYIQYYSEMIFQMPSDPSIYKSFFLDIDRSRGVVSGPHKVFTKTEGEYILIILDYICLSSINFSKLALKLI